MEGGPVGPEVTEPLALLVLDHADPVGQHAVIQNTTSMLEHLPAQPEPSLGGRLGDRISEWEPTARQVPDTTLDSQLMEGITSGSGGVPGQLTHGGDVVSGTIGAVDSSIIMDCT